jgi:NAD-dependent SIR2 family protein deacetylase
MTYQAFVGDPAARRRYWARSHAGWPRMRTAQPNVAHHTVTSWVRAGSVQDVITQNVDGLHRAAGTVNAVELHGALDRVVCLDCGCRWPRDAVAARLDELNATLLLGAPGGDRVRPDGDVELTDNQVDRFVAPTCSACGSDMVKPDVVFFGESVPAERVQSCFAAVAAARSLVVLGSSLTVFSGYRFVRAAARAGTPVAIVNSGPTRADDLADIRVDAPLRTVLASVTC